MVDIPQGFDGLIATALAKDPKFRFQTVGEFDAALHQVLEPGQLEVVPTPGIEQVVRALAAWEQCDVTGALDEARQAEVSDRRWASLRELIEVVQASDGNALSHEQHEHDPGNI